MQEVFSAISQSGSRYWHSLSLWLSVDRSARHYRVTPWAQSKACWELEDMALTLNIHIGHTAQFEILCFNLGRRAMLTLHLENSILRMIFLQCQAQPFQTHSHTCQTGQDVLLAAVSEDLRSVMHRFTHMHSCNHTFMWSCRDNHQTGTDTNA